MKRTWIFMFSLAFPCFCAYLISGRNASRMREREASRMRERERERQRSGG